MRQSHKTFCELTESEKEEVYTEMLKENRDILIEKNKEIEKWKSLAVEMKELLELINNRLDKRDIEYLTQNKIVDVIAKAREAGL